MDDPDSRCVLDWDQRLAPGLSQEYQYQLRSWLDGAGGPFSPSREVVYRALELTCFEKTKVVILGQDPYPTAGLADGLCFSVRPGARIPPSLANIRRVLSI